MAIANAYRSLLAFFIPESEQRDADQFRSARIRIFVYLLQFVLFLSYIPLARQMHFRYHDWIDLIAACCALLAAFLYRSGVSHALCAFIFQIGGAGEIFAACLTGGGLSAPSAAAMLLISPVAMLLGGKKPALIWFGVVLCFIGGMYGMEKAGFTFPVMFDPQYRGYLQFTGLFGMAACMFFCMLAFYNEKNFALTELGREKQRTDALVLNILPQEVSDELKRNGVIKPRRFDDVTILFSDFVHFTDFSKMLPAEEMVAELDYCFRNFDDIIEKHGLEKIKTIGDAYLAVSGLPNKNDCHEADTVAAALELLGFMKEYKAARMRTGKPHLDIRIGISSGPVVAGIVGRLKYVYDIWGEAVNMAARMEQHGENGKINISEVTFRRVQQSYRCTDRGMVEAKNMGLMNMYFVEGKAEEALPA